MASIFLNYRRRGEGSGYAHRLSDALKRHFGEHELFQDVDDLAAGDLYAEEIISTISRARIFIVVIGPTWLTVVDKSGRPRIEQPKDFLRMEIRTALRQGLKIVPVLVDSARMPSESELPEDIKALAGHQMVELTDTRWDYDVGRLLVALEKLGVPPLTRQSKKTGLRRLWLATVPIVLLLAVASFFVQRQLRSRTARGPQVVEFTATPNRIDQGEGSVLTWKTRNADAVSLDGESVDLEGSLSVEPAATRRYSLVASYRQTEQARQEVTVEVEATAVDPEQPATDLLADLVVARFAMDPEVPTQRSPVTVRGGVRNQGEGSSQETIVEWWASESAPEPACSWPLEALAPGATHTFQCEYPGYESWYASLVTKMVVDPGSLVTETDEQNAQRKTIRVERATSTPSTRSITFARLPDGTAISGSRILGGDEFAQAGIRLRGAPEGSYCSNATRVAIKVGAVSGSPLRYHLTTTDGDLNRCNGVPVEIEFLQPVSAVTLVFRGAVVDYSLKAFDQAGVMVTSAERTPASLSQVERIGVNAGGPRIRRVTFGHTRALTQVLEISYRR